MESIHKCGVDAIVKTETIDLVSRSADTNIIRCMWLYKHKFDAEGNFKNHKSLLVANWKSQAQGVYFDETYSPFIKPATIRNVLHVSLSNDWPIHQLEVKNAFLMARSMRIVDPKIYTKYFVVMEC